LKAITHPDNSAVVREMHSHLPETFAQPILLGQLSLSLGSTHHHPELYSQCFPAGHSESAEFVSTPDVVPLSLNALEWHETSKKTADNAESSFFTTTPFTLQKIFRSFAVLIESFQSHQKAATETDLGSIVS
jgi:hypothetical protein